MRQYLPYLFGSFCCLLAANWLLRRSRRGRRRYTSDRREWWAG